MPDPDLILKNTNSFSEQFSYISKSTKEMTSNPLQLKKRSLVIYKFFLPVPEVSVIRLNCKNVQ